MLDYNALKPTDLSRLVDARIGNVGYDPTELIIDGGFDDPTAWTAAAPWTITGGKAVYDDTSTSNLLQALTITAGKSYLLKFDIEDLTSGNANIAWANHFGAIVFGGYTNYANGSHAYVYTALVDCTQLQIFGNTASTSAFKMDNLSLTEHSGEELIPDADVGFVGNDASKWTAYGTNTIAQDGNAVKITYVDNSQAGFILFRAASGTVFPANFNVGDKMKVTVRVKVNTGASVNLFIQDDGGGGTYLSPAQTNTEYEVVTLERTIAGNNFYIKTANFSAGEIIWIELLSIKKVTGLVAAYNMIPSPEGVLVDISGEGNNGTIVGAVSSKDGMKFNGSSDYIDVGSSAISTGTIAIRFKNNNIVANKMLLARNSGFFIYLLNTTVMRLRVNGAVLDFTIAGYTAGNWADVVFTIVNIGTDQIVRCFVDGVESSSGALSPSDGTPFQYEYFGYGAFAGSYFKGEIADAKIFNYAFSEAEAVAYHNQYAKQVSQKHAFSDLGVGSTI